MTPVDSGLPCLTVDEVNEWLDVHISYRPGGGHQWIFRVEVAGLRSAEGWATLVLVNPLARDSRSFDHYIENDEWTFLNASHQTFQYRIPWPLDIEMLTVEVARAVRHSAAHEALEWLALDGEIMDDPHS